MRANRIAITLKRHGRPKFNLAIRIRLNNAQHNGRTDTAGAAVAIDIGTNTHYFERKLGQKTVNQTRDDTMNSNRNKMAG